MRCGPAGTCRRLTCAAARSSWGGVGLLAATLPVAAQPDRVVRIGRLSPLSPPAEAPFMAAFRKGLQELGWVEGQHYTIESRFAEGKIERFPGRAASLVQERVDVILPGSNPGALAAKHRTARTLNVTLPPSFLLRADQVIE